MEKTTPMRFASIAAGVCLLAAAGAPAAVVSLSASGNGAYRPRQMISGANTLNYEVYFDAALTIVWGVGADSHPVAAGNGATVPLYGRIFALQDAAVGTYSDTITVTFNF